mmetsp:Transcript_6146/g.9268  ORF Transcript_6146/g.9268 Transcript_6146/m.9268 type:complete len:234 (-) Transcript_6146:239-940(-)|eukprot:CAMPEP_0185018194 /NCGR_PEP_ID=MMETSP1103-20130426/999_1 /TAXON_ID=36769 /ORGANISM="Paraphysomonas bandaiensis, Strain Caron Lab Isolate" /LENGTH=233 /DNA_ID=CAMNT_0027547923 /DNA_START=175 /DNA_END=876 /DNA_ORIENTATION=+
MTSSPSRSLKSPIRSGSPSKFTTRFGVCNAPEPSFGGEERFSWQKASYVSDVVYQLPDTKSSKGSVFGTSLRTGMDDENPDAKKRTTGPGSYNVEPCYDNISEYSHHKAQRFACAAREGMNMKTPSPGAVYNTSGVYRNGKDKYIKISFNCDARKPLYNESASANADLLWPKLDRGPSITMGKRLKRRTKGDDTPGAIYEVHKIQGFKTGPSFSFGKSKASRFKDDGGLSLDP